MYTHNGTIISPNTPFTLNGKQYPANWLTLAGPSDLAQAGIVYTPDPGPTLSEAGTAKLAEIDAAYNVAVQRLVAYMGTTFQADHVSQAILTSTLVTLNAAGTVPAGFGWWDVNNVKVPMTLAELNGLASVMLDQGWVVFQKKQALKAQARAAATVEQVNAVTW